MKPYLFVLSFAEILLWAFIRLAFFESFAKEVYCLCNWPDPFSSDQKTHWYTLIYISQTIETLGTSFSILEAFFSLNNKCDSGMTYPKKKLNMSLG